jgi:hypothetical protein
MLTEGLARYLDAQGLGVYSPDEAGGSIFLEKTPQTPDQALGIFVSGGPGASGALGWDTPTVQVIVRGGRHDPRSAINFANAVYGALQGLNTTTLPGGVYVLNCVGVQSGPVRIGFDDEERLRLSLNFQLEIQNATQHRE